MYVVSYTAGASLVDWQNARVYTRRACVRCMRQPLALRASNDHPHGSSGLTGRRGGRMRCGSAHRPGCEVRLLERGCENDAYLCTHAYVDVTIVNLPRRESLLATSFRASRERPRPPLSLSLSLSSSCNARTGSVKAPRQEALSSRFSSRFIRFDASREHRLISRARARVRFTAHAHAFLGPTFFTSSLPSFLVEMLRCCNQCYDVLSENKSAKETSAKLNREARDRSRDLHRV